ncbi:hypothetical protein D0T12_06370 [Actinomadura spongiicola]|uniref:Uncharacterized protein n=1 Tax=Actinomadura spongiicola TaxID=2303421 RepID=A0A372GLG6_9ACTN|nr:hypothetical protein D0T12_06370 [Actinomadura spongiicola]
MNLRESLASAGLALVNQCVDPSGLIPPVVTSQAPCVPPEDGRIDFEVDKQDSQALKKANAGWYCLSLEACLFTEVDRRFLVGLLSSSEDAPSEWFCVELQSVWDIMGNGAACLLGSDFCRPEFRMLSLDGQVLSCGSTWESVISCFTIPTPHRSSVLRRFAAAVAIDEYHHPTERIAARHWLDENPW